MALGEQHKRIIIDKLKKLGAVTPCGACGCETWTIAPNLGKLDGAHWGMAGPCVPVTVVVCERCGLVRCHALGILGLLDWFQGAPA